MISLMRRLFIRSTIAVLIVISGVFVACQSSTTPLGTPAAITILHTNDIHGALDDAPRLVTVVNQVRDASGEDNVILVDAGDVYSGTLYSTLFNGEAESWFMNQLRYDVVTLGNHEFDKDSQWLASFVGQLGFPVVNSNFSFTRNSVLAGKTKPWVVIEKGGNRYGVFGLITVRTRELSWPGPDVVMNDEVEAARRTVSALQKEGINKIIALTHLGWDDDLELARQVAGIDVIIGGHTHTIPTSFPTVVTNGIEPTLVVQAGAQGEYLGRLDIRFDSQGLVQGWDGSRLIPIDNDIVADTTSAAKLAEYQASINGFMTNMVGETSVALDGDRDRVRRQETNLGNLIVDSMLAKAEGVKANIALITGGSIRASIPSGQISLGQVIKVLPYYNYLVTVDVTGEQVIAALENGVSRVEQNDGRFPQVSGLRYSWDPAMNPGSRIKSVEVWTESGYKPIAVNTTYRLVTTNFIAGGGDGYTVLKQGSNFITLGNADYEVLTEYIKTHSPVNSVVEGRINQASR